MAAATSKMVAVNSARTAAVLHLELLLADCHTSCGCRTLLQLLLLLLLQALVVMLLLLLPASCRR
jgi:cation transporter-like permease